MALEIELTADQIATYCECAFVEIVEYFGGEIDGSNQLSDAAAAADSGRDFAAFKELESTAGQPRGHPRRHPRPAHRSGRLHRPGTRLLIRRVRASVPA